MRAVPGAGASPPPGEDAATASGRARWPSLPPGDSVCIGAYVLVNLYRVALIPVTFSLLGRHPVLLEALQGSIASLVAAGAFARVGRAALWMALVAPLFGLTFLDPVTWWAGRRLGRRILDALGSRSQRSRLRIARSEELFGRWGPWILVLENYQPIPNGLLYLIAGATGMPLVRFIALDLAGAALWIVPVVGLGFVIGQQAVDVAGAVSRDALLLTAVSLVALVAYQLFQLRRDRGAGR